jgi:hypothetical protein
MFGRGIFGNVTSAFCFLFCFTLFHFLRLLDGIKKVEKNFLKIQETKVFKKNCDCWCCLFTFEDNYNHSIIEDELNKYLDTNKTGKAHPVTSKVVQCVFWAIRKITKKYLKRRGKRSFSCLCLSSFFYLEELLSLKKFSLVWKIPFLGITKLIITQSLQKT